MRTIPKGPVDTRKKLREVMDDLALKLAKQLDELPAQKFDERLAGFGTLTKYITAVNREPEQPEGADLGEYRERLNRLSVVRGGGGGEPDGDGDPDDGADKPADADDSAGPGESVDRTPADTDPDRSAA